MPGFRKWFILLLCFLHRRSDSISIERTKPLVFKLKWGSRKSRVDDFVSLVKASQLSRPNLEWISCANKMTDGR